MAEVASSHQSIPTGGSSVSSGLAAGPLTLVLLAALSTGGVYYFLANYFPVYTTDVSTMQDRKPKRDCDLKNTCLTYGIYGAALCGLFGLAEGISRFSVLRAILGLIVGVAIGAGSGAAAGFSGFASLEYFSRQDIGDDGAPARGAWLLAKLGAGGADTDPLVLGILIQVCSGAVLGFGVGLTLAIVSLHAITAAKSLIVGILSGALGGAILCVVLSVVVADTNLAITVPEFPDEKLARLLWFGVPGAVIGLMMGLVGGDKK